VAVSDGHHGGIQLSSDAEVDWCYFIYCGGVLSRAYTGGSHYAPNCIVCGAYPFTIFESFTVHWIRQEPLITRLSMCISLPMGLVGPVDVIHTLSAVCLMDITTSVRTWDRNYGA
jgi:hypothetical protein